MPYFEKFSEPDKATENVTVKKRLDTMAKEHLQKFEKVLKAAYANQNNKASF